MAALERVMTALEVAGSARRGKDWNCPGPNHANGDRRPSLGVSQGREGALLCCQAGCSTRDILEAIGLEMRDLFDAPPEPEQEIRYPYADEHGVLLYSKIRRPGKKFLNQRADGSWSLGNVRRVLYNLPELLRAVVAGEPVFYVEGERDVENLRKIGVTATTSGGAETWRDEYADYLKGADVTIVADRDDPGVQHALAVQSSLKGVANSVRVVQSRTEGKGQDVSDHLAAGHSLAELVPLRSHNEISRKYAPVNWHQAFASKPSEVDWLFPPILEAGTLNVLFGLPGVGKSFLVLDMVLEILREGRKVMVLDEENRVNEVVERMEKFGVTRPEELENLTWFSFPQLPPLDTPDGGAHLSGLADAYGPDLIIMDTTTRMIEGDENSANTWLQLYR